MRKFIEEHEWEALLILTTMIAITRWWMPAVTGFENVYSASQWALSYDHGLIRRGLVGEIVQWWSPVVGIEDVHRTSLIAFCTFLALLAAVFYSLLRQTQNGGPLFRLMLLFTITPATLSLCARDLGRFDLFLMMITFLCFLLLSLRKQMWLIPLLMIAAMFIHESFLVLWAPTILAALLFVFLRGKKEIGVLVTLGLSAIAVGGVFLVLYKFGTPTLPYEEFSRLVQARATFRLTDLSIRECYFSVRDHIGLASPYLQDPGSVLNLAGALLMLSPVTLILANLWTHAFRNSGAQRGAVTFLFLATLSGLIVMFIATDFGRWLSAVIFCNFFAVFFLISKDIIKVEELVEYAGGSFSLLFVPLVLTYLLFGPLHDWNPYPYQDNVLFSSLAMISVLVVDVGFSLRWRSLRRAISSGT